MEVQIKNLSRNWQIFEPKIERIIRSVVKGENEAEPADEVSVLFCDDKYMSRLNEQYRGVEGPTDVLAFAASETEVPSEAECRSLGDIVVSVETAKRQASESLELELTTLLVHGMLHLLGYDHGDPEDSAVMEDKQRAYVSEIMDQARQIEED